MNRGPIGSAALLACAFAMPVWADGDCARRALTAPERAWADETFKAVRGALPPAPDGWISYEPWEVNGMTAPAGDAGKPKDACASGAGPLVVSASADFTLRDSALGKLVTLTRKRASLQRDQQRKEKKMAGSGADVSARSMDMMALQQQMQAAQASGDMAAMQRFAEQFSKQGEAMMQAQQAANADNMASSDKLMQSATEEMALSREIDALQGDAASAPRVSIGIDFNAYQLPWRQKESSRDLKVSGAVAAWLDTAPDSCRAEGGARNARAVAILGKAVVDHDDAQSTSYQLANREGPTTQRRNAVVEACGEPAEVERFFKRVRFDMFKP